MRTIETDGAPAHTGPVPQAVEVDGWLFVSALFGVDPKTGQRPDSAEAEAEQLFANLNAILRAAGAEFSDVVRVGIFTTHLQRDRPALNEVWKRTLATTAQRGRRWRSLRSGDRGTVRASWSR